MSSVQRRSDVVEVHGEHLLEFGIGAAVGLLLGGLLTYYGGSLKYLGILILLAGIGAAGYAIYCFVQIKKVPPGYVVACPYCHGKNAYMEQPTRDVSCSHCHRMIAIVGGRLLQVNQVRCGFCNALNYYSEKSVGLLCESCDREIPIAVTSELQATEAAHRFSKQDDDKKYDLVLTATGHKNEQLINYLQHLLALNRNQVKQMIADVPTVVLHNVPHLKADLVMKELAKWEGKAESREVVS